MSEMTGPDLHPSGDRDDHEPPVTSRCPSCGALRPPAVAWCTQCYASFDAPDAEPASAEPASAEPASAEPASAEPASAEVASAGPADADAAHDADDAGATPSPADVDGAVPAAVAGTALGPAQRPRDPEAAPVPPEELEARAEQMLALLSVEGDDAVRVRSLSGRLQSGGARVAVIAGATLLLTGLVFGAMAVLGALL